jgi:2-desacetyl-2-hydroxyethyl bacteriochlorophyllide A dehydrogenase
VKAIVNSGPDVLEWRDLPDPRPGPGQVRIRTMACGVCATDLTVMVTDTRGGWPHILGHEWSGVVDAVGAGVDARLVGGRCVGENVLADGGEVGFEHPGGYAELFLTEARNVHTLPDGYPAASAALIEPLAVCVRGVARLAPDPAAAALVFGDGPIGLLTIALLRHTGLGRVCVVGGRPARLALAAELGATTTLNYHDADDDLAAFVRAGAGECATVVEASGSSAAMDASVELAATCGKILVVGDYEGARASFAWQRVLHRELTIVGSNASAGAWPRAVELATTGSVDLARLVTAHVPASSFDEAMRLARDSRDQIKVVMQWSG